MRRALLIGDYFLAHMQVARNVPYLLVRRSLAWLKKPATPNPVSERDLPARSAEQPRHLARGGGRRVGAGTLQARGDPPDSTRAGEASGAGGPARAMEINPCLRAGVPGPSGPMTTKGWG